MKRVRITLAQIASWDNLNTAFYKAAKGAGASTDIAHFRANLEVELAHMQQQLLTGEISTGKGRYFRIRDPKSREIHAPCFRDRVLHHALITHIGPVLDRALIDDSYACRKGKGTLAAVKRCQQHLQRFEHFIQIDIRSYFANIDHFILMRLLSAKLKGPAVLALLWNIIHANDNTGKGLPIGALTSQHFANYYVAGLDRLIQEHPKVRGMVRYMDDFIWFCNNKADCLQLLRMVDDYLATHLHLQRKANVHYGKSAWGTVFCGYRILPGAIRLTRRKRLRYTQRRQHWEQAWLRGEISDAKLQTAYASVLGMTLHADAVVWRQQQLQRVPVAEVLNDL